MDTFNTLTPFSHFIIVFGVALFFFALAYIVYQHHIIHKQGNDIMKQQAEIIKLQSDLGLRKEISDLREYINVKLK